MGRAFTPCAVCAARIDAEDRAALLKRALAAEAEVKRLREALRHVTVQLDNHQRFFKAECADDHHAWAASAAETARAALAADTKGEP
jgi:hypothetical protein